MRIVSFIILIGVIAIVPPFKEWFILSSDFNDKQLSMFGTKVIKIPIAIGELQKVKIGIIDVGITKHPNLNFVNLSKVVSDEIGHGTTVASIISSTPTSVNNYRGLIPGIRLYAYNLKPTFTTKELIEGIEVLVKNNVDIISLSISTPKKEARLRDAITLATQNDIIIVTSAGNTAKEQDLYPASYEIPGMISVGSLDNNYNISDFSTYNTNIDFFCSGENIIAIGPSPSGKQEYSGTSVAVPFITSIVSITRAMYPNSTNIEIIEYIEKHTEKIMASWKNFKRPVKILTIDQMYKE